MELVLVEWVDSAFLQGWMSKESIKKHEISKCTSVGILANETANHITVVQSMSDKQDFGDGISIPKICIKRIRKLKVK